MPIASNALHIEQRARGDYWVVSAEWRQPRGGSTAGSRDGWPFGAETVGVSSAEVLNAFERCCQPGSCNPDWQAAEGGSGSRMVEPVVRRADSSVCAFAASASE
jgi:hypothetical protein